MDALQLTTGGLVGVPRAVTLSTHGYIYDVLIEEFPIEVTKTGKGVPEEVGDRKKKRKKTIKVTVIFKGKKYIRTKIVNEDVKVTPKDVKVKIKEGVIKGIRISVKSPKVKK
jgi:hypothetical protein